MLKVIQIIALFQGIFLLIILLYKKKDYKPLNFKMLFITILSLLFHVIGDDEYNLFQTDANWYIFHSPLIITLFYLLIKYHKKDYKNFIIKDLFLFIPYLVFVFIQSIEDTYEIDNMLLVLIEAFVFIAMCFYLTVIIKNIVSSKTEVWMSYFIIPYAVVYVLDSLPYFITGKHDAIPYIESYGIIGLSVLLLYFILFKLIISPTSVLPKAEVTSYKTSSLNEENINLYIEEFKTLMEKDKLFKNPSITVIDVSKKMNIPRQHLSEILNIHMKYSFQDYICKCRLEEFVKYLKDEKYANYTILGMANEAGFKSKSSFNTAFKKAYGMTPTQFKKAL